MTKKKTRIKKQVAPAAIEKPKQAVHYTEQYLIDPQHPVTINVIGCGGTGSQVLTSLARMHSALKSLGHPGLFVRAVDDDKVSEANMGRQLFSPVDIGEYKSVTLIGRINRFFSLDWEAVPAKYNVTAGVKPANITISCVDSGKSRSDIKKALEHANGSVSHPTRHAGPWTGRRFGNPYEHAFYWMDFGNMKDRGQVVIGTLQEIKQPDKSDYKAKTVIPTIDMMHQDIMIDVKGEEQGPSCSLAEALGKQDLFINTNLANMGLGILWKMFRELHIKYHGLYLNLQTMSVNPISIK